MSYSPGSRCTLCWRADSRTGETASLDAAFNLVEEAVAMGEIPGAIALVSQRGKIVREQAYGL